MKSKKLTVAILVGIVAAFFAFGMYVYQQRVQNSQMDKVSQAASRLIRPNSTVLGPVNAPVRLFSQYGTEASVLKDDIQKLLKVS